MAYLQPRIMLMEFSLSGCEQLTSLFFNPAKIRLVIPYMSTAHIYKHERFGLRCVCVTQPDELLRRGWRP
jgi:hypothetical protein